MFSRRSFLQNAAASSALVTVGCKAPAALKPEARQISKVGLQTYTLREIFEPDPMGTLKLIKAAGYDYVELNGRNFANTAPADLRAMLDEVALPAPITHISLDNLRGDLNGLVKTCETLGCKYAVVPYIADDQRSYADWKSHAALMNTAGAQLRDSGIQLAYHNHQFEFEDLGDGTIAMDIIMGDCAPENLVMELDMFWAYLVDVDIPALFRQYPGRFKLCHIKDMNPSRADFKGADYGRITKDLMVNVGEGIIPFESYFALNDISGMEYFIAEHDSPQKPFLNAVSTSYEAVKAMRF
jgi:sugar phosphate isomerase/epimerase